MTLQYFINYNLEKGWFLTTSPIVSANWKASSGNEWVVPVRGGVGRIFKLGMQPVNVSAQFYGNARATLWRFSLEHAIANCILVS